MVAAPVVPPMEKILSVVSLVPVQFSWPELLPPPRVMEAFVPSELFEPVFPMETAVSDPAALMATAPEKLLFVPVIFTPPVPEVLLRAPFPLMVPERVSVLLALPLLIFRSVDRSRLLPTVMVGRVKVPVGEVVSVALAPVNSSVFPVIVKAGAVPLELPEPTNMRLFSKKFPPMSLFDVAVVPTACVPLNVRPVSAALTGAVPPLQFVPALH